jgi:hypothetical protein
MAQNFARQAISDVRAELQEVRRKRGKKVAEPGKPVNPVREWEKKHGLS